MTLPRDGLGIKRGLRIVLVVPSSSDPAHRRVANSLKAEYRRQGHRVSCVPGRGEDDRASEARLRRLLDHGEADVCHVQFFSRGLKYLAKVRFPGRTRLLLTHQGASVDFMDHPEVFRRLARRADRMTAVSRAGLAELKAFVPGLSRKSRVVPNGVAVSSVHRGKGRRKIFRKPYVLSVGRLAAYKGLDVMAMAFSRLIAEGHDLDWVVCGPDQTGGEFLRFLRKLGIKGRVRLLGAVSNHRTARLMEECRFFVLPSRKENLPMALLEAMAARKAVAATAVGGIPEVVEHGVSGLVVKPGDAGALQGAMRALAGDAVLRRRMGAEAHRRVREFSWLRAAELYSRLCV